MVTKDHIIMIVHDDPHPQFSMLLVSPNLIAQQKFHLAIKETEVTILTTQTTHYQGQTTQNYLLIPPHIIGNSMTPPKNQAAQMLVITMFVELRPHRRMVHGTRPLILSRHGSQGLAQAIAAGEIRLQGNIQQ